MRIRENPRANLLLAILITAFCPIATAQQKVLSKRMAAYNYSVLCRHSALWL